MLSVGGTTLGKVVRHYAPQVVSVAHRPLSSCSSSPNGLVKKPVAKNFMSLQRKQTKRACFNDGPDHAPIPL